jgi:hypothetical protein
MKYRPNDHDKRRGDFLTAVEWLAILLAIMTAFLLTPEVYGRTVNWIVNYTAARYGMGFEDVTRFAWFVMTALIIFFTARATLATAIVAGGVAVATRLI